MLLVARLGPLGRCRCPATGASQKTKYPGTHIGATCDTAQATAASVSLLMVDSPWYITAVELDVDSLRVGMPSPLLTEISWL